MLIAFLSFRVICSFLQSKSLHKYFSVTYVLNHFQSLQASDLFMIWLTKKKHGDSHQPFFFKPLSELNFSKINLAKKEMEKKGPQNSRNIN